MSLCCSSEPPPPPSTSDKAKPQALPAGKLDDPITDETDVSPEDVHSDVGNGDVSPSCMTGAECIRKLCMVMETL